MNGWHCQFKIEIVDITEFHLHAHACASLFACWNVHAYVCHCLMCLNFTCMHACKCACASLNFTCMQCICNGNSTCKLNVATYVYKEMCMSVIFWAQINHVHARAAAFSVHVRWNCTLRAFFSARNSTRWPCRVKNSQPCRSTGQKNADPLHPWILLSSLLNAIGRWFTVDLCLCLLPTSISKI